LPIIETIRRIDENFLKIKYCWLICGHFGRFMSESLKTRRARENLRPERKKTTTEKLLLFLRLLIDCMLNSWGIVVEIRDGGAHMNLRGGCPQPLLRKSDVRKIIIRRNKIIVKNYTY
jgi:hypothetical protein